MSATNYAAMHPNELRQAIDDADLATLALIDADLKREGWYEGGVMRKRIAWRRGILTGAGGEAT